MSTPSPQVKETFSAVGTRRAALQLSLQRRSKSIPATDILASDFKLSCTRATRSTLLIVAIPGSGKFTLCSRSRRQQSLFEGRGVWGCLWAFAVEHLPGIAALACAIGRQCLLVLASSAKGTPGFQCPCESAVLTLAMGHAGIPIFVTLVVF